MTQEEREIGEAYRRAEDAWQDYRKHTGDHSDGRTNPLNNIEKEPVVKLWQEFNALWDPYVLAHPAPKGMSWVISYNPDRPELYKHVEYPVKQGE